MNIIDLTIVLAFVFFLLLVVTLKDLYDKYLLEQENEALTDLVHKVESFLNNSSFSEASKNRVSIICYYATRPTDAQAYLDQYAKVRDDLRKTKNDGTALPRYLKSTKSGKPPADINLVNGIYFAALKVAGVMTGRQHFADALVRDLRYLTKGHPEYDQQIVGRFIRNHSHQH